MKKAVVVGSGAGGATIAKELQPAFDVTVLEAGGAFRPFSWSLRLPESLKRLGVLFDEREIQGIFPAMRVQKASEGMVLVRAQGTGGTTTLATGNAVAFDRGLRKVGINLDAEFEELRREVPITVDHQRVWRTATRRVFDICKTMKLDPEPLPKMGHQERCRGCGRCVLGCPYGIKWDSRAFLDNAQSRGARVLTGWRVRRLVTQSRAATGVIATRGWARRFFPADVVVLAAGGLGTPVILQNSGIGCEPRLFVDPVLCVAAEWRNAQQNRELSMPFYVQREGFLLSPYFDYLSYFFNKRWRSPARDTLSLMIKLADANAGSISGGRVSKTLTPVDRSNLNEAVELCTEIFERLGVGRKSLFLGTLNAGHPGGMLPLTAHGAATLHPDRLPGNVYVADASLFPASVGGPPILTIMALAKRIGRLIVRAC